MLNANQGRLHQMDGPARGLEETQGRMQLGENAGGKGLALAVREPSRLAFISL